MAKSPEIQQSSAVKWRLATAARRLREAAELLRPVAGQAGYCGPPLDVIEKLAEVVAEVRAQATRWHVQVVTEHTLRVRRPRTSTRMSRSVSSARAGLYGRNAG
jgi:hypothetical protein